MVVAAIALSAAASVACEIPGGQLSGERNAAGTFGDDAGVGPATAVAPMPAGPRRPVALLLDPPAGRGPPPSEAQSAAIRHLFRDECRDLLRVARGHVGARMVAVVLEEAAAAEQDATLRWVLLEEALRLAIDSGDPKRIESVVALAADHYRFDALRAELDALDDIPQRALRPERVKEIAVAAERLAVAAVDRPREREVAWKLAADSWRRAGDRSRAETALAEYRRSRTEAPAND